MEETTKEIGGVWLMGHVAKVLETHNRFSAFAEKDDDEPEDNWEEVTSKKSQKRFPAKSKINLTARQDGK